MGSSLSNLRDCSSCPAPPRNIPAWSSGAGGSVHVAHPKGAHGGLCALGVPCETPTESYSKAPCGTPSPQHPLKIKYVFHLRYRFLLQRCKYESIACCPSLLQLAVCYVFLPLSVDIFFFPLMFKGAAGDLNIVTFLVLPWR